LLRSLVIASDVSKFLVTSVSGFHPPTWHGPRLPLLHQRRDVRFSGTSRAQGVLTPYPSMFFDCLACCCSTHDKNVDGNPIFTRAYLRPQYLYALRGERSRDISEQAVAIERTDC